MNLLSCDPGKLNFAYTVFNNKGKILKLGMFNNTIENLKFQDINSSIENFKLELNNIKIDSIILERFIPRSMHKGNIGEIINIKIGIMFGYYDLNSVHVITASTWKNYFNRNKLWVKNDSLPEHILDSMFIGLYYLFKLEYISFKTLKLRLKQIRKTNFGFYRYKNKWYKCPRLDIHSRGKKNSFGN